MYDNGIYDSFFELGGHSLLATQIISQINSLFHVRLPLRAIFEAPTVTGLSALLSALADSPANLEQTAQMILHITQLSDEEVEMMLNESPNI